MELKFKGGSLKEGNQGKTVKFFLFIVIGGKELPYWEAERYGILEKLGGGKYSTDHGIVKVLLSDNEFGKPRIMYPFYIDLVSGLNERIITIRPRNVKARAAGWEFKAHGTLMKPSEAMALLIPDSVPALILKRSQVPTKQILQQIISITDVGESEMTRRLRKPTRKGD